MDRLASRPPPARDVPLLSHYRGADALHHQEEEMTNDIVKRLREPWDQRQSRRVADEFEAADIIDALRAEVERLTGERERLALAICGGEDAYGYANAQTVATLEKVARDNHNATMAQINRTLAAEAERDKLREAAQEAARQLRIIAGMDMIGASAVAFNAARKLEATLTTKGEADAG
jgi:acetyl-CoA carboxylase alpha subunit